MFFSFLLKHSLHDHFCPQCEWSTEAHECSPNFRFVEYIFEERLPSKISRTVPVAQAYVTVVYEWKEQLRHCKCLAL